MGTNYILLILDEFSILKYNAMKNRKSIFLFVLIIFSTHLLYGQIKNDVGIPVYTPLLHIKTNVSDQLKSHSLQEGVLMQLQHDLQNQILDEKPAEMIIKLAFYENDIVKIKLKQNNVIGQNTRLVIGTKDGDEVIDIDFISYIGTIDGKKRSKVSMSFSRSSIYGFFEFEGESFELRPILNQPKLGDENHILYNSSDLNNITLNENIDQETTEVPIEIKNLMQNLLNFKASEDTLTTEIAIDSDYETFLAFNSNADQAISYILSRMALVSQIYKQEMKIKFEVIYCRVWTTADDPYTEKGYPLFFEFRDYWTNNMKDIERDMSLLFIYDPMRLSGGMASGNLCGANNSYAVSGRGIGTIAHELGHLFGSPHTHNCNWPAGLGGTLAAIDSCATLEGGCPPAPVIRKEGTIMSYCKADSLTFHPLVRLLIRSRAEAATCIGGGIVESKNNSVRGKVINDSIGLENVQMRLFSSQLQSTLFTETDSVGAYVFDNLFCNYYSLSPIIDSFQIEPVYKSLYIIGDVSGVNFQVQKLIPDEFEPDNSIQQSKSISTDGAIQDHSIINDEDWISFIAINGETYIIANRPDDSSFEKPSLTIRIYVEDGQTLFSTSVFNNKIVFRATESGTVFMKISGTNGYYGISVEKSHFSKKDIIIPGIDYSFCSWGDFDNDNDLDILWGGTLPESKLSIYINNSGAFTELNIKSPEMSTLSGSEWGDYDNDGDLDIVTRGVINSAKSFIRVYRNDGESIIDTFQELESLTFGSTDWGDYDNDGDIDLLVSGRNHNGQPTTGIYQNKNSNFEFGDFGFHGVWAGDVIWGDYDSDGNLDVIITGSTGSSSGSDPKTRIYHNIDGQFTDIDANLIDLTSNSHGVAWGDYDSDGDLDLIISGTTGSELISAIYRNDNGSFVNIEAGLRGVRNSSVAWGDYDNDGDLDLIIAGTTNISATSSTSTCLYQNDEGIFIEKITAFEDVTRGQLAWGDYDNDNDLDLLMTGFNKTLLYINNSTTDNSPPSKPQIIESNIVGDKVNLVWEKATDDKTPSDALSYNVFVRTNTDTIVMPNSDLSSGFYRTPNLGNAQLGTTFLLKNLKEDTYYWKVQAIDNCFIGGAWSDEVEFIIEESLAVIDEKILYDVNIYPNPTSGKIIIKGLPDSENILIIFVNDYGKFLMQKESKTQQDVEFDISRYPAGTYVLKLVSKKTIESIKIVKI